MIDISPIYKEALTNLQHWKNRYSPNEYYYKVVLNMFYRRYTMKYMWNDIMQYANCGNCTKDFQSAYKELEELYSKTATTKTHQILESNLKNNPSEDVGGSSYNHYADLILKAQNFDKKAKEEIEFCYIYFFIADKSTLIWAAFCATGISKIKSIQEVSGYQIEPMPLNDFGTVSQGLGQLVASPFLNQNYIPLP